MTRHEYALPITWQVNLIRRLINIKVIMDAVESTFFNVGCGHPTVTDADSSTLVAPIALDDLKKVDRRLFVCVRHVVSALGEIGFLLVDAFEHDIRTALKIIIERDYPSMTFFFVLCIDRGIESYKKVKTDHYDGSKTAYDDDPTYYRIIGRRSELASKIQHVMMVNMSASNGNAEKTSKKRKNNTFDFIRSDNEDENSSESNGKISIPLLFLHSSEDQDVPQQTNDEEEDDTRGIPCIPSKERIEWSLKQLCERRITADTYSTRNSAGKKDIIPDKRRQPMSAIQYEKIGKDFWVCLLWVPKSLIVFSLGP